MEDLQQKESELYPLGITIERFNETTSSPVIRFVYDSKNDKAIRIIPPRLKTPQGEEYDINKVLEDPINIALIVYDHMIDEGQPWEFDNRNPDRYTHPLTIFLRDYFRKATAENKGNWIIPKDDIELRYQIAEERRRDILDKNFAAQKASWVSRFIDESTREEAENAMKHIRDQELVNQLHKAKTRPLQDFKIEEDPHLESDMTHSPTDQFELVALSEGPEVIALFTHKSDPSLHRLQFTIRDPELANRKGYTQRTHYYEDIKILKPFRD